MICVIIHQADPTEAALDFILAASNITDNIAVIFIRQGVNFIPQFKALKGFEIQHIYAERESLEEYNVTITQCVLPLHILSQEAITHYVAHCRQIFAF